ncbi:MAG: hypothetical protein IJ215_05960 [Clostridia bacterium]|nr:hypothetical protein [Clostridia bacterium]
MKKNAKVLVVVLVILVILAAIFMGVFFMSKSKKNDAPNSLVEGNTQIENTEVKYVPISKLPVDYSIEDAIKDRCFAVSDMEYNKDVIDTFLSGIENKKASNLRIAYLLSNDKVALVDIVYSNDKMVVTQDNSRSEDLNTETTIVTNEYDMTSDYRFTYNDILLNDGSVITEYMLKDTRLGEEFVSDVILFTVVNTSLKVEDFEPIAFDATVEKIEDSLMVIKPSESSNEFNVSPEFYISLDVDGTWNGITFEVGDRLKITYSGEITETAGMHQIAAIESIDKF